MVRQRERDHKGYDHRADLAENGQLGRAKRAKTILGCTSNTPNAQDFAALLYAGASNANLSDGSVVGDWRLPTLTELKTLTSGTEPVSSVNPRGFTGIGSAYWSSTAENNFSTLFAWYVNPTSPPVVALYNKTITMGVWPVRDGK